ncbi:lipoprotein insertase outer membrane protein LolB [Polaromonas sp. YR568]|uniref:lipoprotein insertase outer membrane protein LolB n=1 Tax=Polaromonas sp. YR568 TaxID=1855301 RepID=UPI00398C15D8
MQITSTRLAGRALVFASVFAVFLVAGCAQLPRATAQDGLKSELWTGRISLQVQSEPVQSFSASFELKGRAERGELSLISPLGNVLGVLRWSPGEAVLDSGGGKVQRFASVDELMAQATGAAVPLDALFAWLQGDNAAASGWSADLSRQKEGRISAKRTEPAPQADLRVVLDQ